MESNTKIIIFFFMFYFSLTYAQSQHSNLTPQQNVEDRKAGNYPGLTAILGAGATVMESIVAFLLGKGSVDDITSAIQGVFFQIQRLISIQGLVGQIPMFGFILQPLVGIIAMILSNAPVLGGLISFILVGPSVQ